MPKKILICEDDGFMAKLISDALLEKGYNPVKLVKEKDPDYVLENIKKFVENEKPDYVLIDELQERYGLAAAMAKKTNPKTIPIIFSGNPSIVKKARERGYNAFIKRSHVEEIVEFIEGEK